MQVKLAVCQLSVTAEKQKNIDHAREVIEKAAHDGAKLIVLPVGVPSLKLFVTPHQDTNVLLLASATHMDRVMKDRAQLYGSAILLGCENELLVFGKSAARLRHHDSLVRTSLQDSDFEWQFII